MNAEDWEEKALNYPEQMTFFLNPKSNDKGLLHSLSSCGKQSAAVAPVVEVRESGDRDDESKGLS